jgi:hypothetical protein
MEFDFVFRVPIAKERLRAGERYMEEVIRGDINKAKREQADIVYANNNDEQEEIVQNFRLLQWLPDSLRYVFNESIVELFYFQKVCNSDLFGYFSLAMPMMPGLSVFGTRETINEESVNRYVESGAESIDILKEELPIFRKYESQVKKKIEKALGISSLDQWQEQFKGPSTTLRFRLLIDSKYDLGNFLIHQIIYNTARSYLIYLYKSVVLFVSKWDSIGGESSETMGLNSRISRKNSHHDDPNKENFIFDQVIRNFEDLKAFTNFLSIRDVLNSKPLLPYPEVTRPPLVLKAGLVLKRGEGPIDFNWNERYFVLYDSFIVYFKSQDSDERRGMINLKDVHIGKISSFSNQEFALKIENPGEDRSLWFTCRSRAELIEWKRALLKIVLNIFDETEINLFLEKTEGANPENLKPVPDDIPKRPPMLERRDTFQEHRVSRFVENPIDLVGLQSAVLDNSAWEFYKVRNLVKIFALKDQLNLFITHSWLDDFKGLWTRSAYCLFLSFVFYYIPFLRYFSFVLVIGMAMTFGYQLLKKAKGASKQVTVILKGKLVLERPKNEVFEYLTNLKNLMKWNTTLHSIEIKSVNKFEGALKRTEFCNNRVVGEMNCTNSAVFFSLKDHNETFTSLEYLDFFTVDELTSLCEVSYYIKTSTSNRKLSVKKVIKDTENRLNSIVLLKNELENDFIKSHSKQGQFTENILYDEQGTFFTRGKPYLETKPRDFVDDMEIVRSQMKAIVTGYQDLYTSNVVGFEQLHKDTLDFALVRPEFDFKQILFEKYFDHLTRPKSSRLARAIFPIIATDSQSIFQRIAELWTFMPVYLGLACKTKKPLKRLKHLISAIVGGLSKGRITGRIPYIPQVGETFQAFLSDGSSIDFEQISSLRSAVILNDVKGRYILAGTFSVDLSFKPNSLLLEIVGTFRLKFLKRDKFILKEKNVNDFSFSEVQNGDSDVVIPKRAETKTEHEELFTNEFIDFVYPKIQANGLVCENNCVAINGALLLNYPRAKMRASLQFSEYVFGEPARLSQAVTGSITSTEEAKEWCGISGSFPNYLLFDNVPFWKRNQLVPSEVIFANRFLPSSVHLREDVYAIAHGKKSTAKYLQIEVALKNHTKYLAQKFQGNLR